MATKIYVSQIDTANTTGGQAPLGSIILVGSNGPYWSNSSINELLGINLAEIVGYTGSVGYQGSEGVGGYTGSVGFRGSVGEDGPQGAVGYAGSVGDGGPGYQGSEGYQGSVGYRGSLGATGYTGSIGYQGSEGSVGYKGSEGYRGSEGYTGSVGGPGVIAFNQLTDTPQDYTGKENNFIRVNASANGLYFDSNTYVTKNNSTGEVNFSSNTLSNAAFKNYSEIIRSTGNSSSSVSIDVRDGNINKITLNAPIVQLLLESTGLVTGRLYSITLMLKQDSSGLRTVDWSLNTIYWPEGEGVYSPNGPTLTTQANYTDFVTLMTTDAGSTWYGVLSGKGFPTP